jgi:hypothetical protein
VQWPRPVVRFGSKADMMGFSRVSAPTSIANIDWRLLHVHFVPEAAIREVLAAKTVGLVSVRIGRDQNCPATELE